MYFENVDRVDVAHEYVGWTSSETDRQTDRQTERPLAIARFFQLTTFENWFRFNKVMPCVMVHFIVHV